ncbi:methylated-DNA--[protein]-cysteine S-methyltransferase [Lacibacterium aquatile]|uniref:Methylated-DNA--protein-cysteine methyltransferase n=1 Tax=Lacibacterium aquatile TaxID=1168082 RepID=A0ABW5DXB1_9PROT
MQPERLTLDQLDSPIGTILLVSDEEGRLRALDYSDYVPRLEKLLRLHYGSLKPTPGTAPAAIKRHLGEYFAGDLAAIDGIDWATAGTEFQQKVWRALTRIPAGTTTSYGALAQAIDAPKAVRAVGAANGANPVGIIVPCHRVIGANGALTGYGGGLHRKEWLLRHESRA